MTEELALIREARIGYHRAIDMIVNDAPHDKIIEVLKNTEEWLIEYFSFEGVCKNASENEKAFGKHYNKIMNVIRKGYDPDKILEIHRNHYKK